MRLLTRLTCLSISLVIAVVLVQSPLARATEKKDFIEKPHR
jgi:hypothetical protein